MDCVLGSRATLSYKCGMLTSDKLSECAVRPGATLSVLVRYTVYKYMYFFHLAKYLYINTFPPFFTLMSGRALFTTGPIVQKEEDGVLNQLYKRSHGANSHIQICVFDVVVFYAFVISTMHNVYSISGVDS